MGGHGSEFTTAHKVGKFVEVAACWHNDYWNEWFAYDQYDCKCANVLKKINYSLTMLGLHS